MSASLVGSEMCIRDSVVIKGSRASKQIGSCFASPSAGMASEWIQRTIVSVSYTHLTLPTICSV
eukprot:671611-Alexandrium_andersonii.AAC.1